MSNFSSTISLERGPSIVEGASLVGHFLPSLGPKQICVKQESSLRRMATHGINRHHPYSLGCGSETF